MPFYKVDLLSPNLRGPGKAGQDRMIFLFNQSDKLSLGLLRDTVTIADSMPTIVYYNQACV